MTDTIEEIQHSIDKQQEMLKLLAASTKANEYRYKPRGTGWQHELVARITGAQHIPSHQGGESEPVKFHAGSAYT